MSNTDTVKKTCQICGRLIGYKVGLIAHHGYNRPFEGWQTASCEGAREVSYEESCEQLKLVAGCMKSFVTKKENELDELLSNPPVTLTHIVRRGSFSKPVENTYERPADFDVNDTIGWNMPKTYRNAFSDKKYELERTIKAAKADLSIMERRIAAWVKVD